MEPGYDKRVKVVNNGEDERVLIVNGDVINDVAAADGDFLVRQSGLWVPRTIVDADIPASIARDSEVTAAVAAEAAARAAADADLQPLDSDLTAIAALTTTTFGRSLLTLADAAAARQTLAVRRTIVLVASSAAITWTDQPSALTELSGSNRARTKFDLSDCTQARLVARCGNAATGATLAAQYSTDQSTWAYLDGSSGPSVPFDQVLAAGTGTPASSWVNLAAGAKADVYLRIVGAGGDGAVDPVYSNVAIQVR